MVIAHRGASGHLPENTLPAYELAIEMGADMIEIDLHRTRDDAIVVTHDDELSGLGGRGAVEAASLAEVLALDAGGGARVPQLDEVLDAFGARIPFNIEIKRGGSAYYTGLEAAALEAVQSRGLLRETLLSSFYDPVLARLREHSPEARIALLISGRYPVRAVERALALGAEAVNPEASITDAGLVGEAHAAGLAVYVYTVDDPAEMTRLLDLGVDGLFTNHPDRMLALLGRGGKGAPAGDRGRA